jgi:hypothetical protein
VERRGGDLEGQAADQEHQPEDHPDAGTALKSADGFGDLVKRTEPAKP